jgi:hypothetical protein
MTPPTHRLHTELQRLFALHPHSDGPVRTLVLGLSGPADWPALATVWRGVQADLDLPAPAIAVNGVDAFELWFSLAQPVDMAQGAAFLQALCQRYLADVAPARWRLWPASDAGLAVLPGPVPQQRAENGHWAAFVAPDLAAVFGDDPSLDLPPGDEAQADLLSRIRPMSLGDWQRAHAQLTQRLPALLPASTLLAPAHSAPQPSTEQTSHREEARRFLFSVMNDPTVDLALRVEAAKGLVG